jgi:hypothetical protein
MRKGDVTPTRGGNASGEGGKGKGREPAKAFPKSQGGGARGRPVRPLPGPGRRGERAKQGSRMRLCVLCSRGAPDRLERMQELGRLRRLGRGRKDRLLVIVEHCQPAFEVEGMVVAGNVGNTEVAT